MLQHVGSARYRANTDEEIVVCAIAGDNNGVESATFRYGSTVLPARDVQGHPGCAFVVTAGAKMLGTVVLFDVAATAAQYDLFEDDGNGNLVDLSFGVPQAFGPIAQFQVDGVAVPVLAAAPRRAKKEPPTRPAQKKAAGKTAKRPTLKGAKKKAKTAAKRAKPAAKKRAAKKRSTK